MIKYEYLCPTSIKEACMILAKYGAESRIIAGGTDLMVQIRDEDKRFVNIKYVVDLAHIREMDFIKDEGNTIIIGALVTHDKIAKSAILKNMVPFLCEAANSVGSPQIRHRGTIGGNICNASPAADAIPPLIALDAEVKIESILGVRTVPLKSIYVKANNINLAADEILTEIIFKKPDPQVKTAFIKLGRRKALAISRINVAVAVRLDGEGKVAEVRISPGCIFATPDRVTDAENVLLGKIPTKELIHEAGVKVSEEMIKRTGIRWSTEYKKPVVEALTRRGLKKALGVE
jgi:CO/xanthine dehydrogenase FAD-binding subunit